jgi:DNA polymerase
MVHVLHRDYETRGILSLQHSGAWKYTADERTEILCCGYAVDDGPVQLWLPGNPVPPEFITAAQDPDWLLCAHNAQFELSVEQLIMRRRHGWPKIPLSRQRCTMAMALTLALPGKLELVAEALGLLHRKDKAGQRLMLMMSKPRRPHKDEDPEGRYWFDDDERLWRLFGYCKQDVETERELYGLLRPLSEQEQELWQLDCVVNTRGFHVDRILAEAARKIAEAMAPELNAELAKITNGAVTAIAQVARLKSWLAEHGCPTESLDKDTIEDLLASEELPAAPRRVLELRRNGAQLSAPASCEAVSVYLPLGFGSWGYAFSV